jgi:carnosine synthase
MLEEYLDGIEVDVDIVLTAGEPVYCKVTDNWPTLEPWFNETGDNSPSILPDDHQRELEALCVGSLKCLGFKCGVFHVEAKYTTRGPRLIEINSRMGGGQVRENNLAVWGVDLVDESLMTAVGLPCHPPVPSGAYTCRSALYFNSKQTGQYHRTRDMSTVRHPRTSLS